MIRRRRRKKRKELTKGKVSESLGGGNSGKHIEERIANEGM